MELEEMKSNWDKMSIELENQKNLTKDLILRMAHRKNERNLSVLKGMEFVAGILFNSALILFVSFYFLKGTFTSFPMKICAVLSISIFTTSLFFTKRFLNKMKKINLLENSLTDNQRYFIDFKRTLIFYKKYNFYFGILIVLFFVPVTINIFMGKDLFLNFGEVKHQIALVVGVAALITIPVILMVFRVYRQSLKETSEAFESLENLEE